jgi:hypothetical protein
MKLLRYLRFSHLFSVFYLPVAEAKAKKLKKCKILIFLSALYGCKTWNIAHT